MTFACATAADRGWTDCRRRGMLTTDCRQLPDIVFFVVVALFGIDVAIQDLLLEKKRSQMNNNKFTFLSRQNHRSRFLIP